MPLNDQEIREIAAQLRQPHGEMGLKVGDVMLESNISMIRTAMQALQIQKEARILEIGHGNGGHLPELFSLTENIQYFGLELSELMHREAKNTLAGLAGEKGVLSLYDGISIPYPYNSFDGVFSVNTLYFWTAPQSFLSEIHRVLKPEAVFSLCFGCRSYMEQLPFARYGFSLYEAEEVTELAGRAGFATHSTIRRIETVMGKTGETVDREYVCLLLKKPA